MGQHERAEGGLDRHDSSLQGWKKVAILGRRAGGGGGCTFISKFGRVVAGARDGEAWGGEESLDSLHRRYATSEARQCVKWKLL